MVWLVPVPDVRDNFVRVREHKLNTLMVVN